MGITSFSINSWRARDKEYGAKQTGEWRILGVGNSYNENQAIEVEDIWSNVLESRLAEAYPDRSVLGDKRRAGWVGTLGVPSLSGGDAPNHRS